MGEKEQGAAREAGAPSLSERKSGSIVMQDREAEGYLAGGDPDFDRASASSVKGSKSNTSERLASGDLPPDTDRGDDEDRDAARVVKGLDMVHHNRGAAMTHEDMRTNGEPPASIASGDSQRSGPIRLDSTPARVAEGGGSDIAIGDPGVNGN